MNWRKYFELLILLTWISLLGVAVWESPAITLPDFSKPPSHQLQLMIADTPEKRAKGLEGVDRLEPDTGMLFVFEQPIIQCMWNRNIKYPLDVAFFTENWSIINAERMEAGSAKKTCPISPAKFAVETNAGTFVKESK